ncbi:BCCT transporter [Virgibacillus dokdonensis]|uniref:BCCT transporter n=1 Tax=Virgibacillus dokdonensis TaxID=302167 RepID=A0A3E0WQK8_9BACI|nr:MULTISPECIES: BCCT family transporter [Virgibacillus]RFA34255.1 BCCT transporter [Virgibacillus dokdonensis]
MPVIDIPVFVISGGLLLVFVIAGFINQDFVTNIVNVSFDFSVTYFGGVYQFILLATFIVALFLGFSKYGKIRLGKMERPEISNFKWISIIMCTLLAGGGVFWAAAEPLSHFISVPPHFDGITPSTEAAVSPALATSFVDWGFLAWAILGTLGTIVFMYAHYHKGAPLKPRALLYPIFGNRIMKKSVLGTFVDAFSIIAVAAGTIGPIGFLGLQAGYGFNALFGLPDTFLVHAVIIIFIVIVAAISAVTGIHKGIQILSTYNVILALLLVVTVLIVGPGLFIFNSYLESFGMYIQNFFSMNTFRSDEAWLSAWTVFFFAWFLGYAPMMAIFVSRISRGRTIREIVTAVAVIAPVVTTFWFTVVGGTGIFQEMTNQGSVSEALHSNGAPAAMIAITEQLPLGTVIGFLFLIATIVFVLTTTDSMSLTISMAITGSGDPPRSMRVFWAILMGTVATVLITIGEDSVGSLQSFIVVTAVPVALLLLTTFWSAPQVCKQLAKEQGIIEEAQDFSPAWSEQKDTV